MLAKGYNHRVKKSYLLVGSILLSTLVGLKSDTLLNLVGAVSPKAFATPEAKDIRLSSDIRATLLKRYPFTILILVIR